MSPRPLFIAGNAISTLLIFLFVYTAVSKLRDHDVFVFQIGQSPLVGGMARLLALLVPAVELNIAVFLLVPAYRLLGLRLSLLLMLLFTLYVGILLAGYRDLPCSCGGVLNRLSGHDHLRFNILFTLLAAAGAWARRAALRIRDPVIASKNLLQ